MDDSNLPPEAGLEERAISYNKGCYIGQEVIARLRTYGQVAKTLRGLRLPADLQPLPQKGNPLLYQNSPVGYITSATYSPALNANIALGYVRREHHQRGTLLTLSSSQGPCPVEVTTLPFV